MEEDQRLNIIENTLFGKEYWLTTAPLQWSPIAFFTKMIELNPTINKRTATYYISQDLENLYVAFIDVNNVKKHISNMQQLFKKPAKSDKDILNNFWKDHSEGLKNLALRDRSSQSVVLSSMKAQAAEDISSKKRDPPHLTRSMAKKRQVIEERENEARFKESDGIFICSNTDSIGTIIKKRAIEIHSKLLNNEKLSLRQRKIMTNGLSSILDLSDDSLASQRSLFTEKEWTEIQILFDQRLIIVPNKLSATFKDIILIVIGTLELSNDYKCCIDYIKNQIEKSKSETTIVGLNILKQILKIMMKYPYMLTKPSTKNVTENDYFRCIWSPIFEAMFPPESGHIRIKSGESINTSSACNKNEQYIQAKYVKSLKIDFRLLVDIIDRREVDVAAGECALFDDDEKAIADEGKLTRESKDALDEIIKISPSDLGRNTCWNIQTTGPHCILSTIHLEAQGLYINKYRHSFNIPSLSSCLEDFTTSIEWLLTMRDQLLQLEKIIQKHSIKLHSNDSTFNRKGKYIPNQKSSFIRDTYYTPPRNKRSVLPVFIFNPIPLPEETNIDQQQTSSTDITTDDIDEANFITEADKYGFRTYCNNRFYNIHTKKFYDAHPFSF